MTSPIAQRRTYRLTSLPAAVVIMWRAWMVVVPVVIANAVIQGLLLVPGTLPYLDVAFVALAVVSFAVLVVSFGLVASAMLQAADGPVSLHESYQRLRGRVLPLIGWSLGLVGVVTVGLALFVIPGLVVLALTPYLLLGVVAGNRQPLRSNFRIMRRTLIPWIVTVVLMALSCLILWLVSALNGFFVTGPGGGFLGWLLLGFVASWFTCAWALLFAGETNASAVNPVRATS